MGGLSHTRFLYIPFYLFVDYFKEKIKLIILIVLGISVLVIWYAVLYFEAHQNLLVHFWNVGQGDSIFIEVPNGNQVLIDGGPSDAVLSKLGRAMPFWDRSIDVLILTHPHADHLDGLVEVLKKYDIGTIIETGVNHSVPEYDEWHRLIKEKKIRIVAAESNQKIKVADKGYFEILAPLDDFSGKSPKNVHDSNIVSKFYYGPSTILFMGDAERLEEYQLLFSGVDLKSDILKIGHHGSKTSSSEEFLKVVRPQIGIIEVGAHNRYGHPYQEVLDRLKSFGVTIYRTDLNDDITLENIRGGYRIVTAKN